MHAKPWGGDRVQSVMAVLHTLALTCAVPLPCVWSKAVPRLTAKHHLRTGIFKIRLEVSNSMAQHLKAEYLPNCAGS